MTGAADNRGNRTQYTLDAMGNHAREEVKDARGNTTGCQYDALSRVTQVSQANGKVQTFSCDGTGAGAQTGHLREFSDSSGSTQYQRDAFGRITGKTQLIADDPGVASNYTTRYGYSSAGELSQISYPSGLKIYYRRSGSGQITGIDSQQPGSDEPIVPFLSDLTYTALGQPRSWRWASGDAAARGFDADGRMAGNEFASYSFDAASRITAITQSLWASAGGGAHYKTAFTWLVGYDRRGRITGFTRPGQGPARRPASATTPTATA